MATEMRQKAKKIVNRRGLGALANNTKWSEFFEEAKQLDVPFEFKMTTIWSYANAFGARCHFMLKAVEWGLTHFTGWSGSESLRRSKFLRLPRKSD
jgi:hypothetical protein